ncbi:MAG: Crp/Fnr family transcriptional regulator [Gammaproteobacteria bacterium]|jgi:CRP-like cAMP-binding protein|nr:Crp/Fnr family transcriptional regulator [Gammaproteobacteria bacterium]MBT3488570.1 Crp/Fnr family transcriptional regulator [Gammaproteobacteria bacterium]MBT3719807.1 Crp/Fnr family transcriptional regulator [Gammaproteobacteria bacterium]MBT3845727.1 Crp/Fnr family transcriptional regulator [Gammaproteobacteria bacterium]MBT3893668.1 Crp/Fnr family transcriptional regulator [Gammaproteobacteria bacterium]
MPLSSVFEREIRRSPLFSSINSEVINDIFSSSELIRKSQHESLFSQGDNAEHFYILRTGSVRLFLLAPDGSEKTINILQPGNSFAEAVMFMKSNSYPVNSQFLEDGEVFSFHNKTYLNILKSNPDISLWIMADLSRQLQDRVSEIGDLCLNSATSRLINYLLSFIPADQQESIEFHLPTQKSVIASRLSIQRETFSRILGKLKKEEMIEVHGNNIRILDPQQMRDALME